MSDRAVHTSVVVWRNLGRVDRIPPGQGRAFIVDGREVAVFRQRDGRLFAAAGRCPHRQGPLADGLLGAGQVICPLHAHKFDLTTGAGAEPAECVEVFPARERGGEVLAALPPAPAGAASIVAACAAPVADCATPAAAPVAV
jgi:nitrite reductase (NADH) small subunit